MKTILTALAAVSLLTLSAYAAEVEGTVQTIDPATRTITLDDGTSFKVGEAVDLASVTAGAKVKLTVDDTTSEVTAVEAQM